MKYAQNRTAFGGFSEVGEDRTIGNRFGPGNVTVTGAAALFFLNYLLYDNSVP
jgi:hypothetical protein